MSRDGRWLLYAAEKKKPKTLSFFAKPSKEEPPPIRVTAWTNVEGVVMGVVYVQGRSMSANQTEVWVWFYAGEEHVY